MDSMMFTAGQAATQAGVTRKAMRLYEAKGLLDEPTRTPAGYRLYKPGDVAVLTFIRQARTLGLHLDDVAAILDIRHRDAAPCQTVRTLIDTRIAEIDAAIADLRALRRTLVHTRATPSAEEPAAQSEPATVCPIVEHTAESGGSTAAGHAVRARSRCRPSAPAPTSTRTSPLTPT